MRREDMNEMEGRDEGLRGLAHRLHLPTTLVKFLIVGGVGFVINTAFLWLIYDSPAFDFVLPDRHSDADLGLFTHGDIRLLISSIVAVEIAIICQFNFHERWTFRWRPRDGWIGQRFAKFQISSIISPIVVVATVNLLTPVIRDAAGDEALLRNLAPYIANGIGVLLGFAWNWTLNAFVIWPHQRRSGDEGVVA
ncbi:MAG TPA: GtrA family protein [Dehalococcoidia bacterium]|nr:GtrA family protein [Dehalococcoidia bacterium]